MSKAVNQPLKQSSIPEINGVGLTVVVWTCQLPSISLALLPQAAAVSKNVHSVNLSGEVTVKLYIEVL